MDVQAGDLAEGALCTVADLFRYAETKDWVLLTLGGLFALSHGIIFPLFSIITGSLIKSVFFFLLI